MKVLSAAGLTPISLHKTTAEPKRLFPFKYRKILTQNIAAISSALYANCLAKALTYEEALNQSVGNPASFQSSSDFDFGQFLDGLVQFGSENPLVIGGGAAVLVVPLILSQVLKQPSKPWGVETANIAFSKLAEDIGAQLVDIREPKDLKEVGKPDVRGLKKKAVAITYKREDKPGFLRKLALRFKEPESTTLFILDKMANNDDGIPILDGFLEEVELEEEVEPEVEEEPEEEVEPEEEEEPKEEEEPEEEEETMEIETPPLTPPPTGSPDDPISLEQLVSRVVPRRRNSPTVSQGRVHNRIAALWRHMYMYKWKTTQLKEEVYGMKKQQLLFNKELNQLRKSRIRASEKLHRLKIKYRYKILRLEEKHEKLQNQVAQLQALLGQRQRGIDPVKNGQ